MIYEDLKEYQDTSKEIRQIEEIIREKWLKLSSLTSPQITDMPIAPNYDKDKLGRQFAEFDELNRMYSQKLEQLNAKQISVEQAVLGYSIRSAPMLLSFAFEFHCNFVEGRRILQMIYEVWV